MKKLLLSVFIFIAATMAAQSFNSFPSRQDTCLNKQFSIVFYVVLDSNGTPGVATTPTLQTLMNNINQKFRNICVTFLNCSTVYIPLYRHKGFYPESSPQQLTSTWYTPNTINVYIVDTVYQAQTVNPERNGFTYFPTLANLSAPKRDLIAIDKRFLLSVNSQLMLHLLGHYFGLPHTHDEINPGIPATPPPPAGVTSKEFASGVPPNCEIHGDGFCDTEADPFSQALQAPAATQDGNGSYYVLPLDNYMSYYGLRSRYTAEQYYAMVKTMMTKRMYLH
jgi:hypothetical protein